MNVSPSEIRCRRESPEDLPAIRAVIIAAFGTVEEADLLDRLRAANALSLSAVAEVGGELVGHVAFSPMTIDSAIAQSPALALAPMAVLTAWQRRGVGSALIRWGLSECGRLGHQIVIVVGHADFYSRFGFTPARAKDIQCPFPIRDEVFRVLELKAGALRGIRGTARYRPEFAVVTD